MNGVSSLLFHGYLSWVENVLDKLCIVPFVYYRHFRLFCKYSCLLLLACRVLLLAL